MDPIKNPFSPGAGTRPPELVGRDALIYQARVLLGRIKAGRTDQSILMTGLRGVGKTVLLNEIKRQAQSDGYHVAYAEAAENKSLGELLVPPLRTLLYELDSTAAVGNKIKRAMSALRGFVGTLKVAGAGITLSLDAAPQKGLADSGDLENDLPDLFITIAEAAVERQTAVALFIDELQYFNGKEFDALIMTMHRMQQSQLPVALISAGLPILPALAGESKSYAERLFSYPKVGALSRTDADKALQDPARAEGGEFTEDALQEIFKQTQGYPYFVQEWGYQSWNTALHAPITREDVVKATTIAVSRLDDSFFRVRFDRMTPSEKKMLRAMAGLGTGPYRTSDVAKALKVGVNSLGPRRDTLIKKGMIYSPTYGDIAFTVPLFDEFMRRAMPDLPV